MEKILLKYPDNLSKVIGLIKAPSKTEGVFVLRSDCMRGIIYHAANLSRQIELPFTLELYSLIPGTSFYERLSSREYKQESKHYYCRMHHYEYLDSVTFDFIPYGFFTL